MERELAKPTFIDLFAGCGGLSLGLMQAGWQGLFAIEHEENAFMTLQNNLLREDKPYRFEWPKWLPQRPHSVQNTLDTYADALSALTGKIDMVVGGPPCQGFSMAGRRVSGDPRNELYQSYLAFVEVIKPSIVLFENVLGITSDFKDVAASNTTNYAKKLIADLSENYNVYWKILNAKDFAVAQSRRRFFAVAIHRDSSVETNKSPFEVLEQSLPAWIEEKGIKRLPISVKRAISDLEIQFAAKQPSRDTANFEEIGFKGTRTPYQSMLHKDMRGHPGNLRLARHSSTISTRFKTMIGYAEVNDKKGKNLARKYLKSIGLKKSSIRVLADRKPSPTITSLPDDFVHYSEPRTLTVRENARLQSFPDWFEFCGKYTTGGKRRRAEVPQFTQVANAVPPLVAEALGHTLQKYT